MSLATFHGKRSVTRVIRSNEWWMWEVAPEEVVLDGDKLRRDFRRQSSLSRSFKTIVRQTNGRVNEAKQGLSKIMNTISSKYLRNGFAAMEEAEFNLEGAAEESKVSHSPRGGVAVETTDSKQSSTPADNVGSPRIRSNTDGAGKKC
uniref:Uncharacterized protein n=1 Tax=Tetraselmis chuii TaxID=63592 RepID=A0A7S1SPF4_9CHLO|mmetsp:Transcript_22043/g.39343  ORF Transcript_22043/g.39343 Transcript_22043/m.39343 type:complete len:147 (+) Transcript_22043:275-715(+)